MPQNDVYVKYIDATGAAASASAAAAAATSGSVSFEEKIKNYYDKGRPFDDKKEVLKRMSEDDKAEFEKIWNSQVDKLIKFENELQIQLPLSQERIETILIALEGKLEELLFPLIDQLNEKLTQDGAYIIVNTIARAYAFHLLTASKNAEDVEIKKQYAEFHRLVRKSILYGDVVGQFNKNLGEVFNDPSAFNDTKFKLYQAVYGDLAEETLLSSFSAISEKFSIHELLAIKKSVLPLLHRADIRENMLREIDPFLVSTAQEYVKENKTVKLSENLFFLLQENNVKYLPKDAIKTIFLQLYHLAKTGNFAEPASKREKPSIYNSQVEFIGTILRFAAEIGVFGEAQRYLRANFADTDNKQIRELLEIESKSSHFFSRKKPITTTAPVAPASDPSAAASIMCTLK